MTTHPMTTVDTLKAELADLCAARSRPRNWHTRAAAITRAILAIEATTKENTVTITDAIARSKAARARASRTVAVARFTDDLRAAHRDGHHTDPDRGDDPTGYWAGVGCPGCCQTVLS